MPYKIDSKELSDYLHTRFQSVSHHRFSSRLAEDGLCILLELASSSKKEASWNRVLLKPRFVQSGKGDKIEISIEPDTAGAKIDDVRGFLEKYVDNDAIFQKGNPLYNEDREKMLPEWKKTLKRTAGGDNKISCSVINRNASTENLRKAIYEYMGRVCLYYLFSLGEFSKAGK